ncbi:hypothetical protein CYFUS_000234 [Cystobacter fuscus]|uniref:Uncharacterized protein n=1 Tax=Cystobacter fuscus TaxID=43 RepID=A0A250IUG4_9BACT|nr:hypothetical protein [Cystobacter fuscus]ATB34827.1 hypothetical protein CYFUS_000234 [Cystobacter fuscus]
MGAPAIPRLVAGQVLAVDSIRSQTLQLLARGQVSEAIDYWVLATGKDAPAWLLATKTAFETSKQVAGACQGVAKNIHTAFTQLGGKPEFVELTTKTHFIMFKMPGGRDMRLTETGYHVLVRMNGRAYDAYTGSAGMPWAEYMSRAGSRLEIKQTVVDTITRAP